MLYFAPWKKIAILGICLAGLVFSMPNLWYESADTASRAQTAIEAERYREAPRFVDASASERAQLPSIEDLQDQTERWPSYLPPNVVNLGLDLRGGVHLLVSVQIEEVFAERYLGVRRQVFDLLREARIRRAIDIVDAQVVVRILNPDDTAQAASLISTLPSPVGGTLGLTTGQVDLDITQEGSTFRIALTEAGRKEITDRTMAQSVEIMRRRIDETGTREPTIQRQGDDRILIQVPGLSSSEELLDIIGRTAKLTFHEVRGVAADGQRPGPGEIVLESTDGELLLLEESPLLTGENLADAQLGFDGDTGLPVVNFRFDARGSQIFGEYTGANIGQRFATVLDGVVITAPVIQAYIPGVGQISGDFTSEEATNLSILLRSGALPASIQVEEERTVGPDLGQDSIEAGKIATILAFIGILIYMAASYGRFGIFANIALVVNVALLFGFLSAIGATLTLPGIAGIVLTIGMAVDANVLIFERIREELRKAKGPARAIERGYEQAFSAIIDANITTFIAAVILFAMGSGPVKGFAVTLGVGIITSVFTATVVTRLFIAMWLQWSKPRQMKLGLFKLVPDGTKLNFMGGRKIAATVSAALVAASVAGAVILGLNFGIDFRGGTLVEIRTEQAADLGQIRQLASGLGLGDVGVQGFGNPQDVLIRIEAQDTTEANKLVAPAVEQALSAAIPGTEVRRVEFVGPGVSAELLQAGILAVVLAVLAVLVYIWLRFEWQFGLAAVVALIHDVALTIGVFEVTGIEFNLPIVAALLTIIGYSLNDTVVVFDRVRENLRKYKQMPLIELLNLSLNETLSRTLMTSVTTLIALVSMYILGPEVIKGFTFAMIWGVIVGTYSSVFVAVATLLWFGVKRDWTSEAEAKAKAGTQFGGAQV